MRTLLNESHQNEIHKLKIDLETKNNESLQTLQVFKSLLIQYDILT